MELLAKFFVSLVTLANTVVPQADLPKVLGVRIAQNNAVEVQSVDTTNIGSLRRTRVREAVEEARTQRRSAVDEFRTRRQLAKDEWEAKREEFKQRLTEIRDERKRRIVELIDLRIDAMHGRWVEHWNKVLARLSEILAKIESRADKAEAAGRDVSSVRAAIATAKTAISAAQDAVNELAGKTFVIEITDEQALGQNVRDTIQGVRSELLGVREEVREARRAVIDALQSLKAIRGVDNLEADVGTQ